MGRSMLSTTCWVGPNPPRVEHLRREAEEKAEAERLAAERAEAEREAAARGARGTPDSGGESGPPLYVPSARQSGEHGAVPAVGLAYHPMWHRMCFPSLCT